MSVKTLSIALLAAAATTLAVSSFTVASAQTSAQSTQGNTRISTSQLANKLEQAGYHIRDIDQKRHGWEVEVTDKNNRRLELRVDNQGNITSQEYDD